MDVQFGDGVAVLVGFGAFDAFTALARRDLFVTFALSLAEIGEDFHEGAFLHAPQRPRGEPELALAVLVEQALLDELLE